MFWFSLFSGGLPFLIGIVVVVVLLTRNNKQPPAPSGGALQGQLQQRNDEWIAFIEAYDQVAETPAEKQLVRHMLYDAVGQGLGWSELGQQYLVPGQPLGSQFPAMAAPVEPAVPAAAVPAVPEPRSIDNTTLLLYFGAFLFVASVGLFVAFGGASPAVRTLAVLLLMVILYAGGQWLYRTNPKLKQAGLAFVAIGIVIAPLVGLAVYQYAFKQQHGALVWSLTSLGCLTLYLHALVTIKKPLISYLLIFTFLSLFESGVSLSAAPVYYFGWGLAAVGIGLQLLNRWKGYYPELRESSRYSSLVLLPVALLVALGLAGDQGTGQLGISLLLAAAFYGLEAIDTKSVEREANAVASQALVVLAASCLAWAAGHHWLVVIMALLAVNLAQVVALLLARTADSKLWHNFASVLMVSSLAGVALAISEPDSLLAAIALLVGVSLAIWWRQRRADAYGLAMLAFMSLPYIIGQVSLTPRLSGWPQAGLGYAGLLAVLGAYLSSLRFNRRRRDWPVYAQFSYALCALSVVVAGLLAGPGASLAASIAVALTFVILAEYDKRPDWAEAAGIILLVPVIRTWLDVDVVAVATVFALIAYIAMALRYRRELLRWGSVGLWLILPLSLGRGAFGPSWTPAEYAWSYLAVMAGLIVSRAVARGVVFFSSRVPLASYTRSASLSYVVGYIGAAVTAILVSLASQHSRLNTTLILASLLVVTLLVSLRVEKRRDGLALLPFLAQAAWLSAVRPAADSRRAYSYLLVSTGLAVVSYLIALYTRRRYQKTAASAYAAQTALVMAFLAPASLLVLERDLWPMPLGLLLAGVMLSHYLRRQQIAYRELAGTVITLSILWLFGYLGVDQLQAYVHVIIANLLLYAYLRYRRQERGASDGYIWTALAVATVPLALQAMAGVAGGLYGWWLLLEQVVFMLVGMAIRRRFVVLWGLYTAVAAVLFQLRHLGWAALTFLAVFLIGLAVYQLQRHGNQN